ncbi:MAG: hypothetical protein LBK74_07605 [Treponema sp.]|jgi:hypothetical protein|nr:hypothetical protein [Treponema sp.]
MVKNMTELCKTALRIIVDSNDPTTLISKAMEEVSQDFLINNKIKPPEWDDVVTEYNGWKIVKGSCFEKLYTLVAPVRKVRVKHWQPNSFGPNFQAFLENVIFLEGKYTDNMVSMIIYHLVINEKVKAKEGCERLTVSEAYNDFPHSKDLKEVHLKYRRIY